MSRRCITHENARRTWHRMLLTAKRKQDDVGKKIFVDFSTALRVAGASGLSCMQLQGLRMYGLIECEELPASAGSRPRHLYLLSDVLLAGRVYEEWNKTRKAKIRRGNQKAS